LGERTDEEVLQYMKDSLEAEATIFGIKGPSPLVALENFDNVNSYVIDYMHCILLGVVKTILNFLYVTLKINFKEVEERILKVLPPSEITRIPDKIFKFQQWKANQSRAFLLHYAYGALKGLIPEEYLSHLMLLSEGIYILLKSQISREDFEVAENKLNEFCANYTGLYGENNVTFNVHLVLHIPTMVLNAGPLFTYSLFPFESKNGQIIKFVRGKNRTIEEATNKFMMYETGKRYRLQLTDIIVTIS
jgi:hypothetical protein